MIIKNIFEFIKRLFRFFSDLFYEQNRNTKLETADSHKIPIEQYQQYLYKPKDKILSNQEIKYLLEKAESFIDSNNFQQALKCYNQLIENSDLNPHFLKRRAWIHRMLGIFDAAISDINKAIELNPDDSTSYWERAACYSHKLSQTENIGKEERKLLLNKILQDYKMAIQKNPLSSEGWLAIIEVEMLLHNWDDAISNYGASKQYIDSKEYQLVRTWLGCLSLVFAGDTIEEEDKKLLYDNSIRLKRNHWCVSEIDRLIIDLEKENFNKAKLEKAREIHQVFLKHFDEPPIRFKV